MEYKKYKSGSVVPSGFYWLDDSGSSAWDIVFVDKRGDFLRCIDGGITRGFDFCWVLYGPIQKPDVEGKDS